MAECIFINLKESLEQFWLLGLLVSHQEGDESFTVRPPQLHVPLQLGGRAHAHAHTHTQHESPRANSEVIKRTLFSSHTQELKLSVPKICSRSSAHLCGAVFIHIQEVEETAMVFVPAIFKRKLQELVHGCPLELLVTALCTELQEEPACFQRVAYVRMRGHGPREGGLVLTATLTLNLTGHVL